MGGTIGVVLVYVAASLLLSLVPVGQRSQPAPGDIQAYILSNGVHTDLVLPVRTPQMDWTTWVPYADTPAHDATLDYVGIGWGDKGFYLDTPTWSQLKPSTAIRAMFWMSTTAVHATFHHRPTPGPECAVLYLSPAEYARLLTFIKGTFALDAQGRPQHIAGHSYGPDDAFYEAKGTYNLFDTCNSWTNRGLKIANQKACLWTPFDRGILLHYD